MPTLTSHKATANGHKTSTNGHQKTGNGAAVATQPSPAPAALKSTGQIQIKAFSNASNVFIVWSFDKPIPNALGFAVYRYVQGNPTPTVLLSSVGFGDDPNAKPGDHQPTTTWPLQRCTWTDWTAPRNVNIAYQVQVVFETAVPSPPTSDVSDWVLLTDAPTNVDIDAFFNDGVIATQWVAEYLQNHTSADLGTAAATPNDPVRMRLGGQILVMLKQILNDAKNAGAEIYAALFEFGDVELQQLVTSIGKKAHIVLSNGSPLMSSTKPVKLVSIDENAKVRAILKQAGVDVRDRIFETSTGGVTRHLGHNKFLVVCDTTGNPSFVWTGSTNWTTSGLCTQMNNAILVRDPRVAAQFKAQWDILANSAGQYPPANKTLAAPLPAPIALGGSQVRATFTPYKAPAKPSEINLKAGTPADLADCVNLINNAKEAILFLMFIPGPNGTLMEAIQARNQEHGGSSLFVRGIANEDPGPNAKVPSIALAHRGELIPVPFDVVYPAAVTQQTTYWLPELLKMPHAHAMIHSKVVVIDPFGPNPAVITGSNNLGFKASTQNDENMFVITGNNELAQQYAVNIITVFNQYWWRFNQMPVAQQKQTKGNVFAKGTKVKATPAPKTAWKWTGLVHADKWQNWEAGYLINGDKRYEIDFWFGRSMTASTYVPPTNPLPQAKPPKAQNGKTQKTAKGKTRAGAAQGKAKQTNPTPRKRRKALGRRVGATSAKPMPGKKPRKRATQRSKAKKK